MRNVSVQEFVQHPAAFLAEAEAGNILLVMNEGRAVATLAPSSGVADEQARAEAAERLIAIMQKGIDLEGVRVNRDELYDRQR